MTRSLLILALAAVAGSSAYAQVTHQVPASYPTIQAAIDAASPGDTIQVEAGVYVEPNVPYYGNGFSAGPNLYQKSNLILQGAGPGRSIIDLDGHYYGLMFSLDSSSNVVEGFTLRNAGQVVVTAFNSSQDNTIRNCVLEASATSVNAFRSYYPGQLLESCTLVGTGTGVALYLLTAATEVRGCIVVGYADYTNSPALAPVTYTCFHNVSNAPAGATLLLADPLFVSPAQGDYHLQSTLGHWDGMAFVPDLADSPAIDAGDPNDPVGLEVMPNGGVRNLGAFGGTDQASLSPGCYASLCGDCNNDQRVDIIDALVCAQIDVGVLPAPPPGSLTFNTCNVTAPYYPAPGATIDVLDALGLAQSAAGIILLSCC